VCHAKVAQGKEISETSQFTSKIKSVIVRGINGNVEWLFIVRSKKKKIGKACN
jgi:hypothetical protein